MPGGLQQPNAAGITITWWAQPLSPGAMMHLNANNVAPGGITGAYCLLPSDPSIVPSCSAPAATFEPPTALTLYKRWSFFTLRLSSSNVATLYVNGTPGYSVTWNGPMTNIKELDIMGYSSTSPQWTQGFVSNVQAYNTTLPATEISLLYREGIGGVPINLRNLVGWWPLNGDAKDYSGNNNDGVVAASGVIYTSGWTGGYYAP
ncbi:Concanavalin A-like lectin/glucanases superfamily protein [uncultured archaeon]|nr:Concanavalin A-like lectin/glucanases superfamily protein [uncultured archaeon]